MKTLAVNYNNDFYVDPTGALGTLTGFEACIQACAWAMQTRTGELRYALTKGVPYQSTVWDRFNPAAFIAGSRARLMQVDDVLKIRRFGLQRVGDVLYYAVVIETTFGIGIVTNQ